MIPLLNAAAEIAGWLDREGIPYAVIGGLGVARWADPRFTKDVDLTVLAPYGEEAGMAARLVSALRPRRDDAVAFARDSRVVLLKASNDVPVDVALGAHDFEREVCRSTTRSTSARSVKRARDQLVDDEILGCARSRGRSHGRRNEAIAVHVRVGPVVDQQSTILIACLQEQVNASQR